MYIPLGYYRTGRHLGGGEREGKKKKRERGGRSARVEVDKVGEEH